MIRALAPTRPYPTPSSVRPRRARAPVERCARWANRGGLALGVGGVGSHLPRPAAGGSARRSLSRRPRHHRERPGGASQQGGRRHCARATPHLGSLKFDNVPRDEAPTERSFEPPTCDQDRQRPRRRCGGPPPPTGSIQFRQAPLLIRSICSDPCRTVAFRGIYCVDLLDCIH